MKSIDKALRVVRRALRRESFDLVPGGMIAGGIRVDGLYVEGVNGGDWRYHKNLLPDNGILNILDVVFGPTSKSAAHYLAPFSGATAPAAGWTATNFASNSSEITSLSEGFSNVTRPACTFGSAAAGAINNYASKAVFNVVCSTYIDVTGLGLLTVATRGGTTGVLLSAVKFGTARRLNNGDEWSAGYQISLSDS
jgi:hypothetical protein